MRKKIKARYGVLGCLGLSAVGLLATLGLLVAAIIFICGKPYYDNSADRALLRKIREPYRDVPAAIEAQHKALGRYPKDLSDFDPALPGASDALRILHRHELIYSSGDAGFYVLYDKLNWDGGLVYSSRDPRWLYDAGFGDGTGIWPLD